MMRVPFAALAAAVLICTANLSAQRASDRYPDLQGVWTNSTATPLQRPADFAGKPFFTEQEAAEWERTGLERILKVLSPEDRLAADLNDAYAETRTFKVVGDLRTSLVVDPPDGRLPPLLPQAQARASKRPKQSYDDPETVGLDARCVSSTLFGTSNGPP